MATYRMPITESWQQDVSVAADSILRHFQGWQVSLVEVKWTPTEYVITTSIPLTDEQMQHLGLEAV